MRLPFTLPSLLLLTSLTLLLSVPAANAGEDDLRDVVHMKRGKPKRGRVLERYRPDVLILQQGNKKEEIPLEDIASVGPTVRENLEAWLKIRSQDLSLDERWALANAVKDTLPAMARLQAYEILTEDPDHEEANVHLGHKKRKSGWTWKKDGRSCKPSEVLQPRKKWDGKRLVIESEHYIVETNAGLKAAVLTLFDLELFYVHWMTSFGQTLQLCEDMDEPEREKMAFLISRRQKDRNDHPLPDFPFYRPFGSGSTTTSDNVARTYMPADGGRPVRLFDLATQQLMFTTMVLGRVKGGLNPGPHYAHWLELGMGYWLDRQFDGPFGYGASVPFVLDTDLVRQARPYCGAMSHNKELPNLIGLHFANFYGIDPDRSCNWAKARAFTVFLLEANPPVLHRKKLVGHGRESLFRYMREIYSVPTAQSSSKFDDALGGKIEDLEEPWRGWLRKYGA